MIYQRAAWVLAAFLFVVAVALGSASGIVVLNVVRSIPASIALAAIPSLVAVLLCFRLPAWVGAGLSALFFAALQWLIALGQAFDTATHAGITDYAAHMVAQNAATSNALLFGALAFALIATAFVGAAKNLRIRQSFKVMIALVVFPLAMFELGYWGTAYYTKLIPQINQLLSGLMFAAVALAVDWALIVWRERRRAKARLQTSQS